jgi:hypothetical protein
VGAMMCVYSHAHAMLAPREHVRDQPADACVESMLIGHAAVLEEIATDRGDGDIREP